MGEKIFTTHRNGSRLIMPVYTRSSTLLAACGLVCKWRQAVVAVNRPHCNNRSSVLQQQVSRLLHQLTAATTDPSIASRSRGVCMSSSAMSQRMVWVDLEGPNLIINQPDELLEGMSEWCKEHHGKSGLTQAVRDSKISLEQAEYEFLSFIRQHTPPGQCPLAGNSVHADKRFLDKYMPQFMYHLHYRIIDVSTIKELSRRWFPEEFKMVPHKKATHRALDDIQESITELRYYRANIFKVSAEEKKRKIVENGGCTRS